MNDKKVNIKNIFSLAYENHTKKNFKLAENLYKKVLQIDDNHLETNFMFLNDCIFWVQISQPLQPVHRVH